MVRVMFVITLIHRHLLVIYVVKHVNLKLATIVLANILIIIINKNETKLIISIFKALIIFFI